MRLMNWRWAGRALVESFGGEFNLQCFRPLSDLTINSSERADLIARSRNNYNNLKMNGLYRLKSLLNS